MINFEDVVTRISTKEGLEYYGVKFNHRGFTICPFHSEKSPSLHYYKKNDTFYCFSCGKGGNIINFVANYFNYTLPAELPKVLKQLDRDFNLGLDRDLTPEEGRAYLEEQKITRAIQKAEKNLNDTLSKNYNKWAKIHATLYKQHVSSTKEDVELKGLLEQLEPALEDYSGNSVRAWPLPTLSEKQIKLILDVIEN